MVLVDSDNFNPPAPVGDLLKCFWKTFFFFFMKMDQLYKCPDKAAFIISKFHIFLQLTGTFSVRLGKNPWLERTIPPLRQI